MYSNIRIFYEILGLVKKQKSNILLISPISPNKLHKATSMHLWLSRSKSGSNIQLENRVLLSFVIAQRCNNFHFYIMWQHVRRLAATDIATISFTVLYIPFLLRCTLTRQWIYDWSRPNLRRGDMVLIIVPSNCFFRNSFSYWNELVSRWVESSHFEYHLIFYNSYYNLHKVFCKDLYDIPVW